MRYIDFDGVILDTEDILFYEWRKNPNRHLLDISDKINYIKNSDWKKILNESPIINDSIYILKNTDPKESIILTKIHSLENEGYEKIKYLRKLRVLQNIILVPYNLKKTDLVNAKNNILIDDCLKNLDDWINSEGYPMFFDKKQNNIDSWGEYNKKGYQKILKINEERK